MGILDIAFPPYPYGYLDRCYREIAAIGAGLRNGSNELEGLLLALQDWHAEARMIEAEDWCGGSEMP